MMKKMISAVLIFAFLIWVNGQQKDENQALLNIAYRMEITSDTINTVSTPLDFILLCNGKSSVYYSREAKDYYEKISNRNEYYFIMPPKSRGSVYKNNNKIFTTLPIGNDLYAFKEPSLEWEIINSKTKKILNYNATLAKTKTDTGQIFYAWFSSDIHISEGPFRFKGLPGLILEVYNSSKLIHMYITELKKTTEKIEPLKYSNVFRIEKDAFLRKRKEYIDNPQSFSSSLIIRDHQTKRIPLRINPNTLLD